MQSFIHPGPRKVGETGAQDGEAGVVWYSAGEWRDKLRCSSSIWYGEFFELRVDLVEQKL